MGLHGKLDTTAPTCLCKGTQCKHCVVALVPTLQRVAWCDFHPPLPSASSFAPLPGVMGWLLQLLFTLLYLFVLLSPSPVQFVL